MWCRLRKGAVEVVGEVGNWPLSCTGKTLLPCLVADLCIFSNATSVL